MKLNVYNIFDRKMTDIIHSKRICLDVFATKECCLATNHDPNNCYYIVGENQILLISIHKRYIFKYVTILSNILMPENSEYNINELQEFIDSTVDFIRDRFHAQWIAATPTHFVYPVFPQKGICIPFGSYRLDLSIPEDVLLMKMNGKHRNVVRRAEREGVKVIFGSDDLINDYQTIDKETWARSGISSRPSQYYSNLVKNLENCLIGIAYFDGIPQAGAIVPYSTNCGYYLHGCTTDQPILGSANLLQWEIIKKLKSLDVRYYDFAGCRIDEDPDSKYHSIQRFKERFGGELKRGFMFKVIYSMLAYNLYKRLIYYRDKKEFHDVIDQEIDKWNDEKLRQYAYSNIYE